MSLAKLILRDVAYFIATFSAVHLRMRHFMDYRVHCILRKSHLLMQTHDRFISRCWLTGSRRWQVWISATTCWPVSADSPSPQSVLNATARLTYHIRRSDHNVIVITDALVCLYDHWLSVSERVQFKIAVLAYKSCTDSRHYPGRRNRVVDLPGLAVISHCSYFPMEMQ